MAKETKRELQGLGPAAPGTASRIRELKCLSCKHTRHQHGPRGMPGYCRTWRCGCESYVNSAMIQVIREYIGSAK